MIVGEGYEREDLEAQVRERGAERWISLPGRVADAELVDLYRRAWVVASTSAREGWGMTITEAAACGTPAVATRIAGHHDAVADGRSGLLVDDARRASSTPLDRRARATPSCRAPARPAGALEHAARFTWERDRARHARGARRRRDPRRRTTHVTRSRRRDRRPTRSTPAPGATGHAADARATLLLALLAYVPPLLTASGQVAADTKQYLYLDPGRLLERAPSMWDPNIGLGTVTHQNIGYLFPMGPFYWLIDQVGVPDWVAQRLWLGLAPVRRRRRCAVPAAHARAARARARSSRRSRTCSARTRSTTRRASR